MANMKLWALLLGLSLLQGVNSEKAQIISPTEVLVIPNHNGVLDYDLSGYGLTFPVYTWTLSAWIYHESITPFESNFLSIVGATTNELVTMDVGLLYNGVGAGIDSNGFSPPFMQWIWLLIGIDASNAFAMYAQKGIATLAKKVVSLGSPRPVESDSVVKLGADGATYTVSSYIGQVHRHGFQR